MTRKAWNIVFGVGSIVGLIGTIAFTIMDTRKAVFKIERKKSELGVDKLDPKDLFKTAFPCYGRTLATGLAAGGCMVGAAAYALTTQATLAGGIGIANKAYNSYREKLRELRGEEEDLKIIQEVEKDKVRKIESEPQTITATTLGDFFNLLPSDYSEDEGEMLFHIDYYDEHGGTYFTSTVPNVMNAIYHFNRNITLDLEAAHSMLLEFLGLKPTSYSEDMMYEYLYNDNVFWIDIGIGEKVEMDDGMVCRPIYIAFPPVPRNCIDEYGNVKSDYEG